MESPEARDMRRALSGKLTRTLNTSTDYPEIRLKVLEALEELNQRLTELESLAYAELHIDAGKPLLRFYMKGGNAYACVHDPAGVAAQDQGGGDSDWDTQVIVNPWAPLPIQIYLYARIEDIVRDQMVKTGVEIARVAAIVEPPPYPSFPPSPYVEWAPDQHEMRCYYELTRDDPQTFRQVFDYDRLGMWMNSRMPLSDEDVQSKLLPGIIFNDGVRPFQLFRMGYTWHAKVITVPPPDPLFWIGPEIERPVLMELIDVTLPRRNTVEAVELWQQFETGELRVVSQTIGILEAAQRRIYSLPLPSLEYHLREQAIMLCEVADGSSRHKDKLKKRLARFNQIWNTLSVPPAVLPVGMINRMAGTTNLALIPLNAGVDATILQYAPNYAAGTPLYGQPGIQTARQLMYAVANRPILFQRDRYLAGRKAMRLLSRVLGWNDCISDAGYSDDVALRSTLAGNGYFDQSRLKSSDIYIAVILRLIEHQNLDWVARDLENQLLQLPRYRAELLLAAQRGDDATLQELLELTEANTLEVKRLSHNTSRHSGISYEQTLVLFCNGVAKACFTLTNAPPQEAPFRPEPLDPTVLLGSVVDLGEQRKASAALIDDYSVRTALSEQFEILKQLFPGF